MDALGGAGWKVALDGQMDACLLLFYFVILIVLFYLGTVG